MTTALLKSSGTLAAPDLSQLISTALSGLASHTRRVYERRLTDFLTAFENAGQPFTRQFVLWFLDSKQPLGTSAYNQTLSAIKRLATEAAENHWLSHETAQSIKSIPSKKRRGVRSGHWLTFEQARAMIDAPDGKTLAGKRDRTVLALLLGCGIRRSELSSLLWINYQRIDNAWHLVDIVGKGNRVRTIRVPGWVNAALVIWKLEIPVAGGFVVRAFHPNRTINGKLSESAIWNIVRHYAEKVGVVAAPHDLRRTFAKLARVGGAPLDVLQKTLGHASVQTTELYTNSGEDCNAGDFFDLGRKEETETI